MKALIKPAPAPGLELTDVPDPTCGPDEVIIRVLRTGICGTDLHILNWDNWAANTLSAPLIPGHEFYGEVVEIGLRTTRIVTLDDNLVSIPNNRFLNDAVASANAGALDQMCVMTFHIGAAEDFETARRVLYEATVASRFVYLRKPVVVLMREAPVPGLDAVMAIELKVKAYVMDGRYESAFSTDVHERVKRALRAAKVHTVGDLLQAGVLG